MKKKNIGIVGGIVASSSIIFFGIQTIKMDTKQNIITWILWLMMDVILALTSYMGDKEKSIIEKRKVNIPWLAIGFTAGASFMVATLILKGVWQFGYAEVISIVGISIALVVWKRIGPAASVIASVVATSIAGVPAIYSAIVSPAPETGWFWAACSFSGILTFFGTEQWTLEQRLFPIATFVLNLGMAILMIR